MRLDRLNMMLLGTKTAWVGLNMRIVRSFMMSLSLASDELSHLANFLILDLLLVWIFDIMRVSFGLPVLVFGLNIKVMLLGCLGEHASKVITAHRWRRWLSFRLGFLPIRLEVILWTWEFILGVDVYFSGPELAEATHVLRTVRIRAEGVSHLWDRIGRGTFVPWGLAAHGLTVLPVSLIKTPSIRSEILTAFAIWIGLRFLNRVYVMLVLLGLESHDLGLLINVVLVLHVVIILRVTLAWVSVIAAFAFLLSRLL